MNRRQFLGVGVATAAVTVAGSVSAMTRLRTDAVVVFDSRFEEAHRFAAIATQQYGLRAFSFAGDATALWHEHLSKALTHGTSVIGLTAGGARFCLQLMASPGVRCAHHVSHTVSTSVPRHVCWRGGKGTDHELLCAASAWPDQAARVAVRRAIETPGHRIDPEISRQYPAYRLPAADCLESWVLAPAPAAMRSGNLLFSERNS